MRTLVTSDWHIDCNRVAGTTPASVIALRESLLHGFRTLIMGHTDKDLLIAGDLFDNFTVSTTGILATYKILAEWLNTSSGNLTLMMGNHDSSPKGDKTASFHFLAHILMAQYGDRVVLADQGFQIVKPGLAVISHVANQDCFDLEIEKALELENHWIVLHCNYENPFADASDHSLNLNEEQTRKLTRKNRILLGHEHQHRTMREGRAICMGNPMPSSIADCLAHGTAQKDGKKYAWILDEEGNLDTVETWNRKGSFEQLDWREVWLVTLPETVKFIRVTGTATAAQAADVISAIAKFRQASDAFVITNGVTIEGIAGMTSDAEISYENVKSFDVLKALLEMLDEREQAAVQELLAC